MSKRITRQVLFGCSVGFLALLVVARAYGQRPQDNWYLEETWFKTNAVTEGGLSAPCGVAVGPDQRVYICDEGFKCVQVYLPDGTFSFSITNGFGGGLTFGNPRGMICDKSGNLYVADYGRTNVYVFDANGQFLRKVGGLGGSGPGQLSGVEDVAVARNGDIYVLDTGNSRVSVFNSEGNYVRTWGEAGSLVGQLDTPISIAISPDDLVYIVQCPLNDLEDLKTFSADGIFIRRQSFYATQLVWYYTTYIYGPVSVRVDASGLIHVLQCGIYGGGNAALNESDNKYWKFYVVGSDGSTIDIQTHSFGSGYYLDNQLKGTHHGVGPDGTMIYSSKTTRSVAVFRHAFREQWVPPRNAIPMPAVVNIQQRSNSPLVDIDYEVTDADDTNVYACMMVFTNATQSLATCIRTMTFAEGTETNLGAGVTANQPHRVTWNAGADLNTKLGDFQVAILARDSRQKLLDIHYLRLPADRGMPALKISRGPLIPNDFMQVWWWLLATQDSGIRLTGGNIYGSGGALDAKLLCDATGTTADGRTYIYAKMNVREATTQEVQWAKEGALAGDVNQWTPTRSVGGRPLNVNEYGFDTGNWDASAWWVVPLY